MVSLVQRAAQFVSRTLKLHPERVLAGKDLDGNTYFEIPAQRYFLGLLSQTKPKRIVVPPSAIQRASTSYEVTTEWNSWLRYNRQDAPTLDELKDNIAKRSLIAERVKHLENNSFGKRVNQTLVSPGSDLQESQSVESWTGNKS